MSRLRSLAVALAFTAAGIAATPAAAVLIVDTGAGPTTQGGSTVFSGQFIAGRFTTTQDWTINSVEGWINRAFAGETGTVAIYTHSGGPATELFSAAFTSTNPSWDPAWTGATGLGWTLGAGTYWMSFETRAGQNLNGGFYVGAPNPLDRVAFNTGSGSSWTTANSSWGMRIDASPVAEPAALGLFGLGLVGLGFAARRRRAG